jgi:spore coat polysaccharide biosynthesis protein SpsF
MGGCSGQFVLVPAEKWHSRMLLEWRNDPVTRANSFTTDPVTQEQHDAFIEKRLGEIRIAMYGVTPVGMVRVSPEGVVSYSVCRHHRTYGFGRKIIAAIMDRPLTAEVKIDNVASHRIFQGLGWQIIRVDEGHTTYQFTP